MVENQIFLEEESSNVVRAAQILERDGGAGRRTRLVHRDPTLLAGIHDRASELRLFSLPLFGIF